MVDARVRLPDEYRTVSPQEMLEFYGKYDEVLGVSDIQNKTTENLLDDMAAAGVEKAIVHAEYEFGEVAEELNKKTAALIKQYPDKFDGFGTVDLSRLDPMHLVEEAKRIAQYGLKGINLQPIFFQVDPLDRRLYPLYATASELRLIISFHTGIHYSMKSSFEKNNPLFIDQIAVDFPDLKIMACHGGWPWIPQMAAVAQRHSNVYIEFGGMDPKYIGLPGSGWEVILSLMNNLLQNQVLFGTDWPVMTMQRSKEGFKKLGLKEKVIEKLFFENAKNMLK